MHTSKIRAKVEKLLKLAGNNPNIHEAAAAFARAQALAVDYGLNLDELGTGNADANPVPDIGEAVKIVLFEAGRVMAWRHILAAAIAGANICGTYSDYRDKHGKLRYYVYGQEDAVHTVAYLYKLAEREIEQLARGALAAYKQEGGRDGRRYARSFRMGAASAFASKMPKPHSTLAAKRAEAAQLTGDVAENALARIKRAAEHVDEAQSANDAFCKAQGLRRGSGFYGVSDASGYAAGRIAGNGIRTTSSKSLTS